MKIMLIRSGKELQTLLYVEYPFSEPEDLNHPTLSVSLESKNIPSVKTFHFPKTRKLNFRKANVDPLSTTLSNIFLVCEGTVCDRISCFNNKLNYALEASVPVQTLCSDMGLLRFTSHLIHVIQR